MPTSGDSGVLLVAHGTVDKVDDLPAFIAEIRRGRPPPEGLLSELRRRYRAIGGSPLLSLTHAQAKALAEALRMPVLVAMRLWRPRVEEVLLSEQTTGIQRLCVLPLAPFSVHVYNAAAERSFAKARQASSRVPEPVFVENWGLSDEFINAHSALLQSALASSKQEVPIVLTAHSLPKVVVERGDPYANLVSEAVSRIAQKVGRPITLAYQSQGADGGPWLGPELADALSDLQRRGERKVVLSPFGFLADHVETLYDIDIEARRLADHLQLELVRVPTANTHPLLVSAMVQVVRRALAKR
jgi:ferrochelatase